MYQPITFDPQVNVQTLNYKKKMLLEDFPCEECASQMEVLKLEWYNPDGSTSVPSPDRVKSVLEDLINDCINDKRPICYYKSNQLVVTKVGDDLNAFFNLHTRYGHIFPMIFEAQEQYRVQDLPDWMKKLRKEMLKICWIGEITYPSYFAQEEKMGSNYMACSGDGMLSLLFEVVSLEGDGQLRYHNFLHNDTKGKDGYPSIMGREIHKLGVRHNDMLTFPEVIEHVSRIVKIINERQGYDQ